MNREKRQKTDKQIAIKFIILCVVGFVVGAVSGIGGIYISENFGGDIASDIQQVMKVAVPVIYVALIIIVYGLSFIYYFKAKKLADAWDGWDEEVVDEAEKKISVSLILSNVMTVCNFFLYGALIYVSGFSVKRLGNIPLTLLSFVLFVAGLVLMLVTQKICVDLEKKLNPEKQGNVLDTDFNKEWMASCDEAQKKMIHEAGYKAHQVTNYVCMIMSVVAIFGMMIFNTGILPGFFVFVIWMTSVIAYSIACVKLEHKK